MRAPRKAPSFPDNPSVPRCPAQRSGGADDSFPTCLSLDSDLSSRDSAERAPGRAARVRRAASSQAGRAGRTPAPIFCSFYAGHLLRERGAYDRADAATTTKRSSDATRLVPDRQVPRNARAVEPEHLERRLRHERDDALRRAPLDIVLEQRRRLARAGASRARSF